MDEIGIHALKELLSQCGAMTVLLVVALVYQTLGRAKDRAAHLEDSKTWTAQAASWVAASTNIMAALSADKELRGSRDAQLMSATERAIDAIERLETLVVSGRSTRRQ